MFHRPTLQTDTWLSAREARQLIFYFIRWGTHREDHIRGLSDAEVESALSSMGFDLSAAINQTQKNPHRAISFFENILEGGTFEVMLGNGGTSKVAHVVDGVTVQEIKVNGGGHAILRTAHQADFTAACLERDKAISEASFDHFYSALAKGFSSIEAYLTMRVAIFNETCGSENCLVEREKGNFVTLDTKLKKWLPKLSGMPINLAASPGWSDFVYLRNLRNDVVIHPKPHAALTTLEQLADGLNRFRTGVGATMFILHQAFREPIQRSIIRAMCYPTVRVVKAPEPGK